MTPSLVALHMRVPRGWARIAEYRRLADGTVGLTVLDEERGGRAARRFFTGVDLHEERRMVGPDEPEAFLRALLRQTTMTYYRFTDESETPAP